MINDKNRELCSRFLFYTGLQQRAERCHSFARGFIDVSQRKTQRHCFILDLTDLPEGQQLYPINTFMRFRYFLQSGYVLGVIIERRYYDLPQSRCYSLFIKISKEHQNALKSASGVPLI